MYIVGTLLKFLRSIMGICLVRQDRGVQEIIDLPLNRQALCACEITIYPVHNLNKLNLI